MGFQSNRHYRKGSLDMHERCALLYVFISALIAGIVEVLGLGEE